MEKEVNENLGSEVLDAEQAAVSRLVGGLKRVEAPTNFERRVMASIAETHSGTGNFFTFSWLRYALPLALVLAVGSFLIFRSYQQPQQNATGPIANAETPAPQPSETVAGSNNSDLLQKQTVAQGPSDQGEVPSHATQASVRKQKANTNSKEPGGGSYVDSNPQAKMPKPEGIEPNMRSNANRNEVMSTQPLPVQGLLSTLGITADYDNGWKVSSVSANSSADHMGIKAGDIILSLGDNELSSGSEFHGSGSFNSVRYSRNGAVKTVKVRQ